MPAVKIIELMGWYKIQDEERLEARLAGAAKAGAVSERLADKDRERVRRLRAQA